jgi:hypothetical protein
MCRWQVAPVWGTGQVIDGCNPRAIALNNSGGSIGLTLLDSAGILPFKTKSFQISPFVEIPKIASTVTGAKPASKTPLTSQKSGISPKNSVTVGSEILTTTKPKTVTTPKTSTPKTSTSKTPKKTTTTAPVTKTTTKKTTTTSKAKAPAEPKTPATKVAAIAPAYQKPQSPSDSVTIGIIGIACAGIGFCLSLLRRKDAEPTN